MVIISRHGVEGMVAPSDFIANPTGVVGRLRNLCLTLRLDMIVLVVNGLHLNGALYSPPPVGITSLPLYRVAIV